MRFDWSEFPAGAGSIFLKKKIGLALDDAQTIFQLQSERETMSNRQAGIAISFDEDNRIRILESEHFRKTENLAEESNNFVQSSSFVVF
jgi:hypothetical protein